MSDLEKDKLAGVDAADASARATTNPPPPPKSPPGSDNASSASDDGLPIDPKAERKLLMKLDFMIWPVFFVIYMMAFLDRINISNAAIQGLTAELHLDVDNRFNVALFVRSFPARPPFIPLNLLVIVWRASVTAGACAVSPLENTPPYPIFHAKQWSRWKTRTRRLTIYPGSWMSVD